MGEQPPRTCAVCHCTDVRACVDELRGVCWWISETLCSHCAMPDGRRAVAIVAAAQLAEVTAELLRFAREGDLEVLTPFALDPAENTADVLRKILQIQSQPGGFAHNVDTGERLPALGFGEEGAQLIGAIERYLEGWA